jgi:cytochrome c
VIRWSLARNAAEQVLRFGDGAVNAVVFLRDGRIATSGEDARIAIWRPGEAQPATVLAGHEAPVVALAVSPDGTTLASASWDHTARVWPLGAFSGKVDTGFPQKMRPTIELMAPRVIEGHTQNVNGVAFAPDGRALVTASYDATLRITPLAGAGAPVVATLPTPLNAVAWSPRRRDRDRWRRRQGLRAPAAGELKAEIEAAQTPIIAVALPGDGRLIAAASIRGSVAVIDRASASSSARWSDRGCRSGRPPFFGQPHALDRRHRPHHPAAGTRSPASRSATW